MSETAADPATASANSVTASEAGEVSPKTTGGRLRAARLARGLTLGDVAEVLRFSAHQIEALERDDYARLPGATLIRGMIRSYAKLLKLGPEPLLAELDAQAAANSGDVRPPTNIGLAATRTRVARVSRGALVALGIGLALFVVLAVFVNTAMDGPAPATQDVLSEAAVPAAPPLTAPVVVLPDATAGPSGTAAVAPGESTPLPANVLVLEFDELSWVEVTDASQSVVLRGEYPKGTRQVVDGKAPFQLWIGRASAVRVSYGERSVDLKPHTREDVARLTIE